MRIPEWRDFTSSHLRTRLARYQIWKAQQTGPSQFVPTSLACQTTTHSVDRSSADASSPVCKVQSFIGLSFRACDFSLSNFLVCMCLPDATYCTVLRQLIITYMPLFTLLMNMFSPRLITTCYIIFPPSFLLPLHQPPSPRLKASDQREGPVFPTRCTGCGNRWELWY